jgi:hypothetical protein
MATISNTATGGGLVKGKDSWLLNTTAVALALVYKSDIVCDGVAQPGNVLKGPPAGKGPPGPAVGAPWTKFNSVGGIAAGWIWPAWPNTYKSVPPLPGSTGNTRAWGYSRINSKRWFTHRAHMNVLAKATAAAAGGTASAISTIDDPWKISLPAANHPGEHNALIMTMEFRGSLRPVHGASSFGIRGDMGTMSITQGKKLAVLVQLSAGWRAYREFGFNAHGRSKPQKPLSVAGLRNLLKQNYSSKKKSLKPLAITFLKDVGKKAGSYSVGLDIFASEQDEKKLG